MASKPQGEGTERFGFNFIFSGKKKWIWMRNWSSTVGSSCRNIAIDFWRNGMCHLVCLWLFFPLGTEFTQFQKAPTQTKTTTNKQNLLHCMETKLAFISNMIVMEPWRLRKDSEILLLGLTLHCSVVAMVNSFSKDHVDTWGWNFVIYFELWGI